MVYPHTFRMEHSETKTTNSMYGEYPERQRRQKINIQPNLLTILQSVDSNREEFLNNLYEIVGIPSISGMLKYRKDVCAAIKLTEAWLTKLGIKYECFDIGSYKLEGKMVKRPIVILGTLGRDNKKKDDVKQPNLTKWKTDPWKVTIVQKRLQGCGVASGKQNLIMWFNLIQAFQKSNTDLPVNLKFIIESLHYYGSDGLEEFLFSRKQDFLFDIKYTVVCDSEWIGDRHPCIVYGSVGFLHFDLTIEKSEKSSSDIKDDMNNIFAKMCNAKEEILIPKFDDYVQQINPDEEQVYQRIKEFDIYEIRKSLPEFKKNWDQVRLLMQFWRLPTIHLGEIQECTCDKNDKSKIKRHFVIKIVPRQIIDISKQLVVRHVKSTCKELDIQNKVHVKLTSASRPWVEDIESPNYQAARAATIQIYKEDPNMIREDCDMKAVTILSMTTDKSVLVLPVGDRYICAGGDSESLLVKYYFEGIKLLSAYLFQVSYMNN